MLCYLVIGFAVLAALSLKLPSGGKNVSWAWVARRAGLGPPPLNELEWPRLALGNVGALAVVHRESSAQDAEARLEVHGLPTDVVLGMHVPFEATLASRFLTGDAEFDRTFNVRAPNLTGRAFFTSPVRAGFFTLQQRYGLVRLEGGALSVGASSLSAEESIGCIQEMLSLGQALLVAAREPRERIARALADERDPSVRLLMAESLDTAEARQTLEALALASELSGTVRATALRTASSWPALSSELQAELLHWLESDDGALQHTALAALERHPNKANVAALERLTREGDGERAALAAESLARVAGRDAEPTLILALQHPDARVRASVVRALGEVGTTRATQALRAFVPNTFELELRQAVQEALRRIEERSS